MTGKEGDRVAQRLSGKVPIQESRGDWGIWYCPCGNNLARGIMLKILPSVEYCGVCRNSYQVFDPTRVEEEK